MPARRNSKLSRNRSRNLHRPSRTVKKACRERSSRRSRRRSCRSPIRFRASKKVYSTPLPKRNEEDASRTPDTAGSVTPKLRARHESIASNSEEYEAFEVSTPEDAKAFLDERDDFPILVDEEGSPGIKQETLKLIHAHNDRIATNNKTKLMEMLDKHNRRLYLSRPNDMFMYFMEKITDELGDKEAIDDVKRVLSRYLSEAYVDYVTSKYTDYYETYASEFIQHETEEFVKNLTKGLKTGGLKTGFKTYALGVIQNKTNEFVHDVNNNKNTEPQAVWDRFKNIFIF